MVFSIVTLLSWSLHSVTPKKEQGGGDGKQLKLRGGRHVHRRHEAGPCHARLRRRHHRHLWVHRQPELDLPPAGRPPHLQLQQAAGDARILRHRLHLPLPPGAGGSDEGDGDDDDGEQGVPLVDLWVARADNATIVHSVLYPPLVVYFLYPFQQVQTI